MRIGMPCKKYNMKSNTGSKPHSYTEDSHPPEDFVSVYLSTKLHYKALECTL